MINHQLQRDHPLQLLECPGQLSGPIRPEVIAILPARRTPQVSAYPTCPTRPQAVSGPSLPSRGHNLKKRLGQQAKMRARAAARLVTVSLSPSHRGRAARMTANLGYQNSC